MKKYILPALGLIMAVGTASQARAEALDCVLNYDIKGGGLQLGVGYFKLKGPGTVTCKDSDGNVQSAPVNVKLGGHPVSATVAAGYLHVYGAAYSVGLNCSFNEIYGSYAVLREDAAVGLGAGSSFSVLNPHTGVRFGVSVEGSYGLAFDVGLTVLEISPVADAPAPAPAFVPAPAADDASLPVVADPNR
jgi:hypothetical protein